MQVSQIKYGVIALSMLALTGCFHHAHNSDHHRDHHKGEEGVKQCNYDAKRACKHHKDDAEYSDKKYHKCGNK